MPKLSSQLPVRTLVGGGLAVAVVASAFALTQASTLVVDGKSTPADVKVINGSAYVRLADVAKALDRTLVAKGGRYELTKAGGANQIGGRAGKIGDVLFDGKWRFTVLSVDTPAEYEMKSDATLYGEGDRASMAYGQHTVKPGRNYKLVIVKCRVSNGTQERKNLWTAISDARIRTAIADSDGSSHVPVTYDYPGGPAQSAPILPGAALTFTIVFALPTDATPKDLVYTLMNNNGDQAGVDVRVSMDAKS